MAPGEVAKQSPHGLVESWQPVNAGPTRLANCPFDDKQLVLLDEVLDNAERVTGLRFSAFLGDLGTDSRATALSLHARLGADAANGVLVALSAEQRIVEVVTGTVAALRISDRAARLAVLSAVSAAGNADLHGAMVNAVRTLADQAGTLPDRASW